MKTKSQNQKEENTNPWREKLKEHCKVCDIKLKDIAVLGINRDPFLCGSPKQIKMGKWFQNIIETYYPTTTGIHLRRVHYYISQKVKLKDVDGKGYYANTYKHWVKLSMASLIARYLGFVDCDIFVDRRNPPSEVYAHYYAHDTIAESYRDLPKNVVEDIRMSIWNSHLAQSYHVEIWVEKSTMNDILVPLCRRHGFVLVTGLGELSLTKVNELFRRIEDADIPCRVFYISDFDPAGDRMPRSISRKIEWFNRKEGMDIKLKPIILTEEQVKHYNLPRAPIKAKTERATTMYKKKFEEQYGEGAAELDALESLYPGEFEKIVKGHVLQYFDVEKHNAVVEENNKITEFVRSKVAKHLKTLKLPPYKSKFKFPEPDLYVLDGGDKTWLYDSSLDYDEQLERYKKTAKKSKIKSEDDNENN